MNEKCKKSKIFLGLNTKILDSLNMNQDEIIRYSGLKINRTTLSDYIKGYSIPPVDVVIKLAILCKVSVNDILLIKDEYDGEAKAKVSYKNVIGLKPEGRSFEIKKKKIKDGQEFEVNVQMKLSEYIDKESNMYSTLYPYYLYYDCNTIKAPKGSIIIADINPFLIEKKGIEEHLVMLQHNSSLFPTIIRKVRDDNQIANIKANIYSYIDWNGQIAFATINNIYSMYKGTIVKIIRNL